MNPRQLVVSLHDVHPQSLGKVEEQRRLLSAWGVAHRSLLVVPEFHHGRRSDEPAFVAAMNEAQAAGDEIVLHGYYHDREGCDEDLSTLFWSRFYTNREAEFLNLGPEETWRRVQLGLSFFRDLGWKPRGFIAPAWLLPQSAHPLLAEAGFVYTTTLRHFVHLQHQSPTVSAHSLCWSTRAPWRRTVSRFWNPVLSKLVGHSGLIRISLHPDDLTFPELREQIERIVKSALDRGFVPVTYADYAAG